MLFVNIKPMPQNLNICWIFEARGKWIICLNLLGGWRVKKKKPAVYECTRQLYIYLETVVGSHISC